MAHKLTAETMLSLPRPGAAKPNSIGSMYIMPYSHFSFEDSRTTRSVALGKLHQVGATTSMHAASTPEDPTAASATDRSRSTYGRHDSPSPVVDLLSDLRYSDVAWLDDQSVAYLRPRGSEDNKADVDTSLSDKQFKKKLAAQEEAKPGIEIWYKSVDGPTYKMGELPVEITDLKTVQTGPNKVTLAFSAEVFPEEPTLDAVQRLEKEYQEKKEGADVQVYDSLFIRHWGEWTSEKKKLVFTLQLERRAGNAEAIEQAGSADDFDIRSLPSTDDEASFGDDAKSARWTVVSDPVSPLAGLENIECPSRPFGDSDDYDITANHLAFVAKDPHLPVAWHTRMHVYLVPLHPRNLEEKTPKCITSQGGARSFPVFSAVARSQGDGRAGKIAWLEMRTDGYEADRNRVMIYDLEKDTKYGLTENWDKSPLSLAWGEDDSTIFVAAEDQGHKKLFALEVPAEAPSPSANFSAQPRLITDSGTVSSYTVLPTVVSKRTKRPGPPETTRLLVTINSYQSPNEAFVITVPAALRERPSVQQVSWISSSLVDKLAIGPEEEFWFSGADPERQVHGFLLRPHGFEKGKKYPLAFLVHGGPQGAWTSSWSTRWNPAVFAAQGYVVVAINPTGSTGYGQDFTDAINRDWGGKPFKDLVAGLDFVKRAYSEMIDEERMAMLGASYGGYMCNWIQGHNDVTKFKVLVCHDGILDTKATWFSTEELYFPEHDLGGTPWEVPHEYEKWSPANHIRNWRTPQLIIHGGKDFRLPETEGIGVFNVLQRKGVPSKLVYFPNENHWVLNPLNSRKWHKEIFDWLQAWVGKGPSEVQN